MLRKRLVCFGFCLLLVFALALGGCGDKSNGNGNGEGNGSDEEVYELKYQLGHQRTQYLTQQAHIPFAERLGELSDGRLKVVLYDSRAITDDIIEGVKTGLLQISHGAQISSPGQFPLSETFQMPLMVPSATVGSLACWDVYENFPSWRAEYDEEVVVLGHFTSATYQIHSKKPIRTLEDVQGIKLGVWDQIGVKIAENLGAIPVNDSCSESAMNLDRGLIDAVMCPLAPVKAFGAAEIATCHTIGNFYVSAFYVVGQRSWIESLPEDLQELILNNFGAEFAEACGIALDEGALIDGEWMANEVEGTEFIVLEGEELARWQERVKPIRNDYLEKMEELGLREEAEEIIAHIEKFSEEAVASGVFVPDYNALNK
ncbi:MAG TPA: hypothetical protein GX697_03375 [Firmicutes bacterium]|nr:hypothetical protein [Bacillota bacterium]